MTTLQDFSIKTLDGKSDLVSAVKGKVVLVVNVASKCGLTPQYKGMQSLHSELESQGFSVVGFPCNQFGGQEPGSPSEIDTFCSTNYSVTFPLSEKIDVNGAEQHAIFKWMQKEFPGDIEWNFGKFLIDRSGKVIKRYPPQTVLEDAELLADIAAAL